MRPDGCKGKSKLKEKKEKRAPVQQLKIRLPFVHLTHSHTHTQIDTLAMGDTEGWRLFPFPFILSSPLFRCERGRMEKRSKRDLTFALVFHTVFCKLSSLFLYPSLSPSPSRL